VIVIPAIDIRGGDCVQLVGGDVTAERVRLADPSAIAARWARAGFGRLHLVDLDAALGVGSNGEVVDAILDARGARCQVGGGIRSTDEARRLLERGAERVIVGSMLNGFGPSPPRTQGG
jgi:phosphoribosylformimino-5-aminoimidazole carboxamide ribotide isomerase